MISEKCEQEIKYCDVVDEGRETINYKKIFENIIESRQLKCFLYLKQNTTN